MTPLTYWEECISWCDIELSDDQLQFMAKQIKDGHTNYSATMKRLRNVEIRRFRKHPTKETKEGNVFTFKHELPNVTIAVKVRVQNGTYNEVKESVRNAVILGKYDAKRVEWKLRKHYTTVLESLEIKVEK